MKKVFLLLVLFSVVLLTGCSKEEELKCDIGATDVTITVKDGKIISYVDKIEGEIDNEEVKQLNKTYLKDITKNSEALNKLKDVIASMGGNCK